MLTRWLQTSTPGIASPLLQANHRSALTNTKFVDCFIKELLENRYIHMVTNRTHIFSPMSVVTNREGKKRLVLNLRYLNNFLLKERFKYEDIKVAISLFRTAEYAFTFDLKLGYHYMDIHKDHWKYLGFQWGVGSKVRYCVFGFLSFCLATACYLFTKLLRQLVKYWRQQGLRVVLYAKQKHLGCKKVRGQSEATCKQACATKNSDIS